MCVSTWAPGCICGCQFSSKTREARNRTHVAGLVGRHFHLLSHLTPMGPTSASYCICARVVHFEFVHVLTDVIQKNLNQSLAYFLYVE